jgi:hypothetical protein
MLTAKQLYASVIICLCLLTLIIRLVQKGRLDISYCWLWLGVALGSLIVVIRYDLLDRLSALIGSLTRTTTLFMLGFLVILLMCLQFSLVISSHRRQIKRLSQQLALLRGRDATKEPAP